MFSGIIEELGIVRSQTPEAGALRLTIATGYEQLALGESIALNGACLTVAKNDIAGEADFFASPETLGRTNLGNLQPGARVNLERSITLTSRLSGHLVQGHIDGRAFVTSVRKVSGARELELTLPSSLYP